VSIECSECEWDARSGHDPDCSRSPESKLAKAEQEVERLRAALTDIVESAASTHPKSAMRYMVATAREALGATLDTVQPAQQEGDHVNCQTDSGTGATATCSGCRQYRAVYLPKGSINRDWFCGDCLFTRNDQLSADLEAARAEVERMRSALKPYANQGNWFRTTHLMQPDGWPVKVWAWDDHREPWTMAQRALDAVPAAQQEGNK
jgi:hypothetical protein